MQNIFFIYFLVLASCNNFQKENATEKSYDSIRKVTHNELNQDLEKAKKDSVATLDTFEKKNITTRIDTFPAILIAFAKTLIGTPYKYASVDPAQGLDCSGFITYVFNHFNIIVPRSSVDFTNYGITINERDAKAGDLILFTGTDSTTKAVGHMGIVVSNKNDDINFIHSTSGHANGVTITGLNKFYRKRFVKVIRIPFFANEK